MFAAGTGIAPFRGFIQERAAQLVCGRKVGPTILYFGCRSDEDFLYAGELEGWSKLGAIQVKTAFSRQECSDGKYVQDLVWKDRKEMSKLFDAGARFYACGSATKLAASLKSCFIRMIIEHHQCDEEKAAEILETKTMNR
jgi:cytochrome P450/NADPH-cytochrome P450 reductase